MSDQFFDYQDEPRDDILCVDMKSFMPALSAWSVA